MDKVSIRKITEDRIANLQGDAFQELCDRLCFALYPNDYVPVRAGGPKGDQKNDGYCPKQRIFFQAHATRGETIQKTKDKIKKDLEGCLLLHPNVKVWNYLTNDTLIGEVETFVDNLRIKHPELEINTWGHKVITEKILDLDEVKIQQVLAISMTNTSIGILLHSNMSYDLAGFEYALQYCSWSKELIDGREYWICYENRLFQVEESPESEKFTEAWTQVYPDKFGSHRRDVNLKIFGVTIKQYPFISCDGGRISVPMPRTRVAKESIEYYWLKDSLEYKLGQRIGSFYIYDNLEGIAAMSKIILE